jgi:hypothetical protein
MRWKVFFWVIAFITIIGLPSEIIRGHIRYIEDVINNVFDLFFLIGIGSYTFKKIIFPQTVWKIVFILFIVNFLALVFFQNIIPATDIERTKPYFVRMINDIIIVFVLFFEVYVVYKLGFSTKIYSQQKFKKW